MKIRTKKGDIKEIIYDERQLYNYGLNRLSDRDYLRAELFTKMSNLQPDADMVNGVLDKLVHLGYLDDKKKIRSMLNSYSSKESTNKTKNRLVQKGADKDLINEVIDELQQEDTKEYEYDRETDEGIVLLENKFREYTVETKEKMLRFLISKGFNYTLCSKIIKIFKEKQTEK